MILVWIISFSLVGGIGAVGLAGAYLLFPDKIQHTIISYLINYVTGTLLGAACFTMGSEF